ncbi:hypothetical protein PENSPDRAFT_633916 [Peniophora sp. CONT]|nr:hypothetical protein PENSPDRAFT_633916 [Peniophora sp. CONT]
MSSPLYPDTTPKINDPVLAGILESVSELMKSRLPYTAGTLALPSSAFTLYYEEKDSAKSIDLLKASDDELERLTKACDTATFGRGNEDVLDKTYRTAGKLDAARFATTLVPERTELSRIVHDFMLEGKDNTREIVMELYKLNIYGKGSFFKSHVDTPRSERMFGSLVLAFPTPHKGGELVLRPSGGTEYTFDSGIALVPGKPRVGYAAFFSDVEHEVLPVTEGHRITLTFNLYYGEEKRTLTPESVSARMAQCKDLLIRLLQSKKVLPGGGLLCFGMKHAYPVSVGEDERELAKAHQVLKGADRLVRVALNQLRLETNVQLLYRPEDAEDTFHPACGLSSKIIDMEYRDYDSGESDELVIIGNGTLSEESFGHESVLWVTPPSGLTSIKYAFGQAYGNEVSHGVVYADLCLVSRVKPYSQRIEDFPIDEAGQSGKRKLDADGEDSGSSTSKRSKMESVTYSSSETGEDSGREEEGEEDEEDIEDSDNPYREL